MAFYPLMESKCHLKTIILVTLAHLVPFFVYIHFSLKPEVVKLEPILMVGLISQPSPIADVVDKPKALPKQQNTKLKKTHIKHTEYVQAIASEHPAPEKKIATEATIANEQNTSSDVETLQTEKADELRVSNSRETSDQKSEAVYEAPKFGVAYLHNPPPEYPLSEKLARSQGKVLLRVLVNENGQAEDIQIHTSSGHVKLDLSAVEAVKKWQFIPARLDGKALSAYVIVPVKFKLVKSS